MEKDKVKLIEDLIVGILDDIMVDNKSIDIFVNLDNILKTIGSEECVDNLLERTSL